MSQIKKGAALNYTSIILTNIVGLLLTPFIIRKLGDAEFGLYSLIGAFVGYIAILDLGLGNTVVRFVAKYRAEKDKVGEENFLATTLIIYAIISFCVVVIGTICYFNIESIFKDSLTPDQIGSAKNMFVILVFTLAVGLPAGTFEATSYGYEQFVFPKTAKIIHYVIRSLLVVGLLFWSGRALSLVILDASLNLVLFGVMIYFVIVKLKVKIKLHSFSKQLLRKIFGYSLWIFVFAIVGQFQWRVGQLVLGIMTDPTIVAVFAVGVMLGTYYGAFSTAISGVFLPRATQMTVTNANPKELTDMMIKIGRLSFIVLMFILTAFILFGKQFIFLWVGESYQDSWVIALIIMFAYTLPLVQAFGNSILEAQNKLSFKAIIYLIFLILGTIFGGYLAKGYGAIGMIAGTVSGWLIVQNIMNFYYYKVIHLEIPRFFKELLNKTFLAILIILVFGYFIRFIPGKDWFNFVLKGISYSIVYALVMYRIGLIEFEKQLFKTTFSSIRTKFGI
ncbi:oligosaccharide flippase family protein [Muricauda sp. HICW]|uniref:Oligosaccharide flippase family protein n=1 Tax=Flagellimonas chongwuensis TaxID=2697365 RepID=A0A850NEQ3_9FLAO|nr:MULTISPECIES: oligosaccharide flippase family protein [Allomuricauda]NVN19313.1 oligosaccharide flippase family protein [Allomuricauda chongwuensis]